MSLDKVPDSASCWSRKLVARSQTYRCALALDQNDGNDSLLAETQPRSDHALKNRVTKHVKRRNGKRA